MYKVCIYNNEQETVIHYPTADSNAPHVLSMTFKESLSLPEQLSMTIPWGNPSYNLIQGLITKVKVYDIRDNSVVFSGRALTIKDGMSNDGKFNKDITCEGALAFLNDTNTRRWNFKNQTPQQILQYLLNQHNSKVDASRQIQLGVVEITQPITIDTNYETTLNSIITKIRNILGGDLRVRETDSILYLDYLITQGSNNNVEIRIGYNAKEIIRENDPSDIIARGIGLGYGEGVNQLDIKSVNNGLEYIDNPDTIAKYGVIEGIITNKDIQNPDTLKLYVQTVLKEKSQPKLTYEQTALDLSVLSGHEDEKYELGDTLHTIVDVLGIDVYSRVIERERDLLLNPWNPKLTISTRPIRLSDQVIELKQRSQTLEQAPQGSTYIDTYGFADNIDSTHSFQLPVWLSPDILNVNRVRLHIDSQKYRADSKNIIGGSSTKNTTDASSKTTSDASSTSVSGGGGYQDGSVLDNNTIEPVWEVTEISTQNATPEDYWPDGKTHPHVISKSKLAHYHQFGIKLQEHSHDISHTHGMNHTHGMQHTHTATLDYGILEDTFPKNITIKIDGSVVAGTFAPNAEQISIDIDLTQYIGEPGKTYNLEITSEQNGRVNAWISVQAFIQAK